MSRKITYKDTLSKVENRVDVQHLKNGTYINKLLQKDREYSQFFKIEK